VSQGTAQRPTKRAKTIEYPATGPCPDVAPATASDRAAKQLRKSIAINGLPKGAVVEVQNEENNDHWCVFW
jgi:hypothetical protein